VRTGCVEQEVENVKICNVLTSQYRRLEPREPSRDADAIAAVRANLLISITACCRPIPTRRLPENARQRAGERVM
jgi:hypothetical protein